ncbi:MAG TPA: TonB-dependent receptor [Bacteroidales bacterium]
MVKQISAKLLLLFAIILCGSAISFGQSGAVTGVVLDMSDGMPLPGASVVIKGTTIGTVTDINGKFSLNVEPNTTLVVSYVGYTTQELLTEPGAVLKFTMQSEATGLSELVVIGYGTQKKKDATGSVTPIGTEDFNKGQITDAVNLMSGKVAGVQIISAGGAPGANAQVRIRGGSSLSANNDPLWVIDGVPVDNDGISGARSKTNTLNPNDIETMTVLKDASATAIYGSRASNGVIIITTKKGKAGSPLKLEYNGNFTLYTPTKTIDVLDSDEMVEQMNLKYPGQTDMLGVWYDPNGNSVSYQNLPDNPEAAGYVQKMYNTNWQDEIFTNAFGTDNYISATGAAKHMPYRVSLGYSLQNGILMNDQFQRTTGAFSLTPSFLEDHLTVGLNGQGTYITNEFADNGAIGAAFQFDPTKPVTDATSPYGGYWAWLQANGNPVDQATRNPVALLNLRSDQSKVKGFVGSALFNYKVHGFEDLKLTLNLGMDYSNSDGTIDVPSYAAWEYNPETGGGVDNYYEQEKKNSLLDFYMTYTKYVESIKSNFDVMVGYSWQNFWRKNYSVNSDINHTPSVTDTIDDQTESYLVSFFGRFNYTFNDKYLVTFTLRDDGTSRFSPDTRWGLFPSVALAWKINQEGFLIDSKTISQLKLRLGWGITGQQNIGQGDYPYLARYTYSQINAQYQLGNLYYYTLRAEGYDANIKWEETTTWNVGIDYGFAADRYYGSLDFYYRETDDLLNFIPVPAGSNLTNYLLTNVGNMTNKGVEFSVFTRPIVKEDLMWEIGFNATYNKNEITKLTSAADSAYLGVQTGGISGGVGNFIQIQSVGFPANSFFVLEQVYDEDGYPIEGMYVDRNGDGMITDDDKYHYKKPASDFYFGINSMIDWKNWQFAFSGRANFGNYVYNNVAAENGVYERLYRPEGPYLGNVASYVFETNFTTPQYTSDYFIQDASFFKMDYISLSYVFRELGNSKLNLRVSGTVNNAFTITQYDGLDPEITNGIDGNLYPRPRAYVLGINLQF